MLFETQGVCNGSIITGAGEWWRALPALPIPDDLAPDLPTVCTAGMPLSRSPLPLIMFSVPSSVGVRTGSGAQQ